MYHKYIYYIILIVVTILRMNTRATNAPVANPSIEPTVEPTSTPSLSPTTKPSTSFPTVNPTALPSMSPSFTPTSVPSTALPSTTPTIVPSKEPSFIPSFSPTFTPTFAPSRVPTGQPSGQPSRQPSTQPTRQPSSQPTSQPSRVPTGQPTRQPSRQPSSQPTRQPSSKPTGQPSRQPSSQPTRQPSSKPTGQPSRQPSSQPTMQPFSKPTSQPSRQPSSKPTGQPSRQPSSQPTRQPSSQPTSQPSRVPTGQPTRQPSRQPTTQPTSQPSMQPTTPSSQPTSSPTGQPSRRPSSQPSRQPSRQPTSQPSRQPTSQPSRQPTSQPTGQPTRQPSSQPTSQPSRQPSSQPTRQPSSKPTGQPSRQPSSQPTRQPSRQPTTQPTAQPSMQPTTPSSQPTSSPTGQPSRQPSSQPSRQPSRQPTGQPSRQPTSQPSRQPTSQPTGQPTRKPSSSQPSSKPSSKPSRQPTAQPTSEPTNPTGHPTRQPSGQPSCQPSGQPSRQPTRQPTGQPTRQPSSKPSRQPTGQPTSKPSTQPTLAIAEFFDMNVTNTILGINATKFNANSMNKIAFLKAYSTATDIGLTFLTLTKVTDIARRRLHDSERALSSTNGTYKIEIEINIKIFINPYTIGCQNLTDCFRTTKIASDNAVSNGKLLNYTLVYSNTLRGSLTGITVSSAPKYSAYKASFAHSPRPSSQPTSMPTCSAGSSGTAANCGLCTPGTYSDEFASLICSPCAAGYYGDVYGMTECLLCPYPTTNLQEGMTGCPNYSINISTTIVSSSLTTFAVIFLFSLVAAGRKMLTVLCIMTLPTLNALTNLVYLLCFVFVNEMTFKCYIFAYLCPNLYFIYKLIKLRSLPKAYIPFPLNSVLGVKNTLWLSTDRGYPLIDGQFSSMSFDSHDNIPKGVLYVTLWLILIFVQFWWLFIFFMWFSITSGPLVFAWFAIGVFLVQSKVISIDLDTALLNESLFADFVLQASPMLIIQAINNSYQQLWTERVVLLSYITSGLIAIIGTYRFIYIKRKYKLDVRDVPFEFFGYNLVPLRKEKVHHKNLFPNTHKLLPSVIKAHPEEIAFQLLLLLVDPLVMEYLIKERVRTPLDLLYFNGLKMLQLTKFAKEIDEESYEAICQMVQMFPRRRAELYYNRHPEVEAFSLLINLCDRRMIELLYRYRIQCPASLTSASEKVLTEITGFIGDYEVKKKINKIFDSFPARRFNIRNIYGRIYDLDVNPDLGSTGTLSEDEDEVGFSFVNDDLVDEEELKEFDPREDICRITDTFAEDEYISRAAEAMARSQLTNLKMGLSAVVGLNSNDEGEGEGEGVERQENIEVVFNEVSLDTGDAVVTDDVVVENVTVSFKNKVEEAVPEVADPIEVSTPVVDVPLDVSITADVIESEPSAKLVTTESVAPSLPEITADITNEEGVSINPASTKRAGLLTRMFSKKDLAPEVIPTIAYPDDDPNNNFE